MIRLVLQLIVLTPVFWFVIYGLRSKHRRPALRDARQYVVALLLAIAVVLLMSLFAYFGGLIHG